MKYTILVVTYNKGKYIEKCLDSILNQTYKNFELIVIDDGSTDNTKQIIKKYQENHKFKYYYKKNTGVADTRNYAVSKVKTKYFMFIDSDDYIHPNLLEKCNYYKDYDLLCFGGYKVTTEGKITEKIYRENFYNCDGQKALFKLMKLGSLILVPWGYIYNIDVIKKNEFKYEKDYVMEDVGLTPLIILNCKKVTSVDFFGYYYVQSDESIIRTKKQDKINIKTKSILFHIDNLNNYVDENINDRKIKNTCKDYFTGFLIWYGTELDKNNLNTYIKELKKRKAEKNISKYQIIKKVLCSISYKLYYILYRKIKKRKE